MINTSNYSEDKYIELINSQLKEYNKYIDDDYDFTSLVVYGMRICNLILDLLIKKEGVSCEFNNPNAKAHFILPKECLPLFNSIKIIRNTTVHSYNYDKNRMKKQFLITFDSFIKWFNQYYFEKYNVAVLKDNKNKKIRKRKTIDKKRETKPNDKIISTKTSDKIRNTRTSDIILKEIYPNDEYIKSKEKISSKELLIEVEK